MDWRIKPTKIISGEITVPPDKSVSHRAVMLGSIADGKLEVRNFLMADDCLQTVTAFKALGVDITLKEGSLIVKGVGLKGLKSAGQAIYLGNSGTSMRLISGILAGQGFASVLTGDKSLMSRPMMRVIEPLKKMNARVGALGQGGCAPLEINPQKNGLKGITYTSNIASAQVKSCVLFAGLYADGVTSVIEPYQSRDHSERMLEYFSADISKKGLKVDINGGKNLISRDVDVPGDISSAAFMIIAALITKKSELVIKNIGLNPTRIGILQVLERMGADIKILSTYGDVEPCGDIRVKRSDLRATIVREDEIPLLIDEIPILCVASALAEGTTRIKGVAELKVKETDRVYSMVENLTRMGVEIFEDGGDLLVKGVSGGILTPGVFDSYGDHRTAMSMAIASLVGEKESVVKNAECVNTSYPGFLKDLYSIGHGA